MKLRSPTTKPWIWLLIGLYVFALPYVIVVYELLIDRLSLPVARSIPAGILVVLAGLYFVACHRRGSAVRWPGFVLPAALLPAGVVWLEPNTVKWVHIPEYMVLSWLLFLAMDDGRRDIVFYASIFLCAVLLGVIDEIHQGMHPGRYYGWKDMLINAAGGITGILLLMSWYPVEETAKQPLGESMREIRGDLILLVTSAGVAVASCAALFSVQRQGAFSTV